MTASTAWQQMTITSAISLVSSAHVITDNLHTSRDVKVSTRLGLGLDTYRDQLWWSPSRSFWCWSKERPRGIEITRVPFIGATALWDQWDRSLPPFEDNETKSFWSSQILIISLLGKSLNLLPLDVSV